MQKSRYERTGFFSIEWEVAVGKFFDLISEKLFLFLLILFADRKFQERFVQIVERGGEDQRD